MNRTEQIAALRAELTETEEVAAQAFARVRGLEVQIAALEAGAADRGELADMPRQTDAILAVLHQTSGTLTPSEITSWMNEAGRSENLKTVSSLLSYLLKEGKVQRPSRGHYMAV